MSMTAPLPKLDWQSVPSPRQPVRNEIAKCLDDAHDLDESTRQRIARRLRESAKFINFSCPLNCELQFGPHEPMAERRRRTRKFYEPVVGLMIAQQLADSLRPEVTRLVFKKPPAELFFCLYVEK